MFFKKYFYLLFLALICLFALPTSPAKAYSPIIASCSNGVLDQSNIIYVNGGNKVEQLFDVRLDHYYLDAVAVRIKSHLANKEVRITVTDRGDGAIASTTQIAPTEEKWVYVDFNNVPMPRAVYLLKVESVENVQIAWKYSRDGNCIQDSHLINNDNPVLSTDMAFAIYAYDSSSTDASAGDRTAPPAGTNDELVGEPLQTDSNSIASKSNSTQPTKNSNTVSGIPSKEDILKMTRDGQNNSGLGLWGVLFSSPIMLVLIFGAIGFLVFLVAVVILIIWLVNKKKKKSDQIPLGPK